MKGEAGRCEVGGGEGRVGERGWGRGRGKMMIATTQTTLSGGRWWWWGREREMLQKFMTVLLQTKQ